MTLRGLVATVVAAFFVASVTAEAAERRCRDLGTKAFKVRQIHVDGTSCRQGRQLGQSYAAFATDEARLRRSGRADINGYTCVARRERRRPLRLAVRCSPEPAESPDVVVPSGRVRFLVLGRS